MNFIWKCRYFLILSWEIFYFQGAFWALMVGLVIGIVRMIMDFAYSAPLCMEEDLRPAIVSQVYWSFQNQILKHESYCCHLSNSLENLYISVSLYVFRHPFVLGDRNRCRDYKSCNATRWKLHGKDVKDTKFLRIFIYSNFIHPSSYLTTIVLFLF